MNATNTITTVLFDLGRVLVDIDFEAFPNALGLTTAEMRAPFSKGAAAAGHLYETGAISTGEFLDRLYLVFQGRFGRGHLLHAWDEIIREDVPGMAELVDRVQRTHQTAMLSNTGPSHFEKAERTCVTVQKIPRRFLSYEMGAAKPAPAVYRRVIDTLGAQPGEILFIDDLLENVDGARALGINGVIFTDRAQLERDLVQWNILPPHSR